jgi:hypothetical protein
MVANWWNPVELIAPMAYLVAFVYAMIGSAIVFGKIVAVRDARNQWAHRARLQQVQARMIDVDQPVSRPQTTTHLHLATDGDVPAMRVSDEPSRNLTIPAPRSLVLEDRDERAS